jgi:hypothetical protein
MNSWKYQNDVLYSEEKTYDCENMSKEGEYVVDMA